MLRLGLLDTFDSTFAGSFSCFLPPPYNTADEIADAIDAAGERAALNLITVRRLTRRRYAKRLIK